MPFDHAKFISIHVTLPKKLSVVTLSVRTVPLYDIRTAAVQSLYEGSHSFIHHARVKYTLYQLSLLCLITQLARARALVTVGKSIAPLHWYRKIL